jgi:chromosome segregation ATPase
VAAPAVSLMLRHLSDSIDGLAESIRTSNKLDRIILSLNDLKEKVMAGIDDLNARVDALTQNQADTAAAVGGVSTKLGELRTTIQALRDELAANAENGVSAEQLQPVLTRLDEMVSATQANEDELNEAVAS